MPWCQGCSIHCTQQWSGLCWRTMASIQREEQNSSFTQTVINLLALAHNIEYGPIVKPKVCVWVVGYAIYTVYIYMYIFDCAFLTAQFFFLVSILSRHNDHSTFNMRWLYGVINANMRLIDFDWCQRPLFPRVAALYYTNRALLFKAPPSSMLPFSIMFNLSNDIEPKHKLQIQNKKKVLRCEGGGQLESVSPVL